MNDRSNVYPTILYNLAKVWGLAPFSMRRNIVSEGSVRNLIVPSIIVIICVPIAIMTVFGPNADFVGDTTVTMVSDTLSSQANIASIMVTLGTFMVKRKQIVTVIRSFLAADRTLKRLGIERDYREQFQRITIYVFVSCGFTFILEIGSGCFFWFTLDAESRPWAICSMFVADIVTFVKHLAVQIFLVAVRITDERFGHVNDLLSKLCSSRSKNSPLDLDRPEVGNLSREIPKPSEKLKMIEELFNDVTDSAEKTVQLFSLPLCVIIANNFMNITVTCYYVYVATTNLDPSDASMATVQVLATISWALVKVVETIAIAVICDSAQNTANSAARFLHKMWIQDRPTHMRDEIQMLSLQLLHRPLQISAFGFFALDYSYLYKIFCAVAAYFVIMVQLDSARAS